MSDLVGFEKLVMLLMNTQVLLDCGLLDANKVTQWYDIAPAMDEDDE